MVTNREWEELGEIAYNSRFEKYQQPWHELPKEVKEVWIKVARAVIKGWTK